MSQLDTTRARAASPRRARRPKSDRETRVATAVLLGPFTLLLIGVFLIPIGITIYLSAFSTVFQGAGFGTGRIEFVGLRNLISVFTDPSYWGGMGVVALYGLLFVPLSIVGGLALALLLDSGLAWGRSLVQVVTFLPHSIPGIIAALIWLYLYTPGLSPILKLLESMKIEIDFLGANWLVPSFVNVALWGAIGYNMVVFYAALKAVPGEVLEAARVDGASRLRTAISVKVPMIRSSLVMIGMFSTIATLQLFSEPLLFQSQSPAISSQFTPTMYIYTAAFSQNNYGVAASAALILVVVSAVLSYLVVRLTSRRER